MDEQMSHSNSQHRTELVGLWAWYLPAAYGSHVAEEALGGSGLMDWMTAGGGVRLSLAEFIGLNLVGAGMMCLAAWAGRKSKVWRWPLASGATIILVNGICHIAVCVMTRSYVAGSSGPDSSSIFPWAAFSYFGCDALCRRGFLRPQSLSG